MYFADIMINIIKDRFIIRRIGRTEKNKFLLFLVSSEISLDKASGRENVPILISREKVGRTNMYMLRPFGPINLVMVIFMTRLRTFVTNPPIKRINVDFINFSFIVKFMKIIKKIYHY